jgi:ribosome-binding protein aMBF1 (putative translation factor)
MTREQIRHKRTEAGLTQLELAQRVDVPEILISRIETGRCTPTTEQLESLERVLLAVGS